MLEDIGSGVRRRRAVSLAALSMPWIVAACAVGWRIDGLIGLVAALMAGAAILMAIVARATRHVDATWAARQLDDRRPDLEDSSGLLLPADAQLSPLQQLQRTRIERRLEVAPPPDLRPPWPGRALALSWLLGAAIAAVVLLTPPPREASSSVEAPARPQGPSAPGAPALVGQRLEIEPPAYTGLPTRTEDTLDAKVPAGSRLRWSLRFEPQPAAAELVFHDQSRVPLVAADGAWTAERTIDRSALYRLVLDGATSSTGKARHRLDVVADQPPSVTIVTPTQNVTLHEAGQRHWPLQFEARDDYGLEAARLHLTLAQGGGENVTVTERVLPIRGDGDRRQRQYTQRLDLESLGFAPGDDLIVRLSVDDNRRPTAHTARSASLILRWPPESGDEPTGMEGMVRKTLPAYFRSQRQVIIDTEALIAERGKLPAARFNDRSDAIGVDQRLLRLRYGQFLGEEAEDVEDAAGDDHDAHEDEPGAESGAAVAVLEKFGHTHDIPEAATLLDRETRELLRSALREMWQAELHLRQGQPARALPYEYRALDLIKQVQQATRIYLARVGLELPPIDESRRLAGDATGVRSRGDVLAAATTDGALLAEWWARLDTESEQQPADLAALAAWVRAREAQLPQAIELLAAIEALNDDAQCTECRHQLRGLLWPLLPAPPTSTSTRAHGTGVRRGLPGRPAVRGGSDEPRRHLCHVARASRRRRRRCAALVAALARGRTRCGPQSWRTACWCSDQRSPPYCSTWRCGPRRRIPLPTRSR